MDDPYVALVRPVALLVYCRCVRQSDDSIEFEHHCENYFETPADILARLGIVDVPGDDPPWLGGSHRHVFQHDWTPHAKLTLHRHSGEPTTFDLLAVLCFLVGWDSPGYDGVPLRRIDDLNLDPPPLDMSDDLRFAGAQQRAFHEYAFGFAAEQLAMRGLGAWGDDSEGFRLAYPLEENLCFELARTYQATRFNMAKRLGDVALLYPPR